MNRLQKTTATLPTKPTKKKLLKRKEKETSKRKE